MKKWVKKVFDYEDLKEASFNFVLIWLIGQVANIISQKFFNFSLNQFNSVVHLAIGVGLGTYAYRRAGGRMKGILLAFIFATLFNAGWESIELGGDIFKESEKMIDFVTDIVFVYFGAVILGPLIEKIKKRLSKKKGKNGKRKRK